MPTGGAEAGGVETRFGQAAAHAYFLPDVRFSGTLQWGDVREAVEGNDGWVDRQWTPRFLGVHAGLLARRYRHEWRQIHLDNDIQLSVWTQYDRGRANRLVPFSGVSAADAEGRCHTTTDFRIERLSFVRDPRKVEPLLSLPGGARWFTDRYRLLVPSWDLDIVAEPIVPAPAHRLPIEYWSGPTRIAGTMDGRPVTGFGFHERTLALTRDFELVDMLRETVRRLPGEAAPEGGPAPSALADLVWRIDGFLGHRDAEGALRFLRDGVRPELEKIAPPHRGEILEMADDLAETLLRWWVRP
jgi:hypothetical protein